MTYQFLLLIVSSQLNIQHRIVRASQDLSSRTTQLNNLAHQPAQHGIHHRQIQGHENAEYDHDRGGTDRFRPRRKRNLLEFTAHTLDEFSNRGDQSMKHGYNPLLERSTHFIDREPTGTRHTSTRSGALGLAGALGFEPRLSVLETDVLPLTPCPSTRNMSAAEPRAMPNPAEKAYFTSL